MFEHEAALFAFQLHYARRWIEGVPDEQMTGQPSRLALNHPARFLGHLGKCRVFALAFLGLPRRARRAGRHISDRGASCSSNARYIPRRLSSDRCWSGATAPSSRPPESRFHDHRRTATDPD